MGSLRKSLSDREFEDLMASVIPELKDKMSQQILEALIDAARKGNDKFRAEEKAGPLISPPSD